MSVDPGELAAYRVCKYLVQSIVEHPDEVKVKVDDSGERRQLEVSVADGDMGRVIGKRGRVANAIRTVVRAAAVQDDAEVDVEFLD
ncbi:MAG: KH domain-containing protein [Acidimicrobiia bacterium]|nr:KH domain-containing protein [Acidimicrobiia bacterium]MDH5236650.1 KH domain-containing protein [Acidimicrobiia bacterium]